MLGHAQWHPYGLQPHLLPEQWVPLQPATSANNLDAGQTLPLDWLATVSVHN